jgi:transcription elongation factor GreB
VSKAFTKESDGSDDTDDSTESGPVIPAGTKNYMTPRCAERLREELKHLRQVERPEVTRVVSWAAGNGDRSENGDYTYGKKRLREIDRRMRYLAKRLESAEIVDPATLSGDKVLFGATVTLGYENGDRRTYAIVGVDEIDPSRGKISWLSPLARALLGNCAGDVVPFHAPGGTQEIEILSVEFKGLP